MKNILAALASTFIIWIVTLLTTGISLPFFNLFLVFCISYLFVKEVKYEGDK